jgi:hypothetical protein
LAALETKSPPGGGELPYPWCRAHESSAFRRIAAILTLFRALLPVNNITVALMLRRSG